MENVFIGCYIAIAIATVVCVAIHLTKVSNNNDTLKEEDGQNYHNYIDYEGTVMFY